MASSGLWSPADVIVQSCTLSFEVRDGISSTDGYGDDSFWCSLKTRGEPSFEWLPSLHSIFSEGNVQTPCGFLLSPPTLLPHPTTNLARNAYGYCTYVIDTIVSRFTNLRIMNFQPCVLKYLTPKIWFTTSKPNIMNYCSSSVNSVFSDKFKTRRRGKKKRFDCWI